MRPQRLDMDVVIGGVVFLFALVLLAAASRIPPSPISSVVLGPRVMPMAVSAVLAAAAVVLAVRGLLRTVHTPAQPSPRGDAPTESGVDQEPGEGLAASELTVGGDRGAETEEPGVRPGQARRFFVITGMLLGYILLFFPVGYLLSTFAFLAAASTYVDPRKWRRNLAYAAIFSVVVYVAFTLGLNVQLPPGVLG